MLITLLSLSSLSILPLALQYCSMALMHEMTSKGFLELDYYREDIFRPFLRNWHGRVSHRFKNRQL